MCPATEPFLCKVALRRAGSLLHATAQDSGFTVQDLLPTHAQKTGCSCALGSARSRSARPACQPRSATGDARGGSRRRRQGQLAAPGSYLEGRPPLLTLARAVAFGTSDCLAANVTPDARQCPNLTAQRDTSHLRRPLAAAAGASAPGVVRTGVVPSPWAGPRAAAPARRSAARTPCIPGEKCGKDGDHGPLRAGGVAARAERARRARRGFSLLPLA